jgi:uncharacterized protein (DUF4415 family)
MAKRNTKAAMYQPRSAQQPKRRAPAGKPVSKSTSKSARVSSSRPSARPAQATPRTPVWASLLTVRIAAIVITVAAIAGGTAWAISLKNNIGVSEAIGLILLGFLAGLGIIVAMRPAQVVASVAKIMRERR